MYDANCIHIQQPISSNHFNVRMVDQNNLTYRNLYMSGYSSLPYGHKNKKNNTNHLVLGLVKQTILDQINQAKFFMLF